MQKRRNFIKTLSTGALIAASHPVVLSCKPENTSKNKQLTDKVKTAMLSMQRASWEHGVAAQALLESGDYELTYLFAKEAALRQTDEGRLSVLYTDNGVTDPAASGEAVLKMAKMKNDSELLNAHKKMLHYLMHEAPRTEDGIIHHTLNAPEIWVDSIYMAPPYLSAAGEHAEAVKQIKGIRKYLWNGKHKLFSHRWHAGKNEFINEKFWGVGNGWAIASYARVIDSLPPAMKKEREQLVDYAKENIDGCLKYIRPDGLFHNIVNNSNSFVETNLSQMIAYGIFRGVKSGWLNSGYLEKAEKMRKAAHNKIDELGFVQGACGAPWFNSPGRATESQAFFLLMEAALTN
jgi:rhamnogalacturonyl hydrolase YesR